MKRYDAKKIHARHSVRHALAFPSESISGRFPARGAAYRVGGGPTPRHNLKTPQRGLPRVPVGFGCWSHCIAWASIGGHPPHSLICRQTKPRHTNSVSSRPRRDAVPLGTREGGLPPERGSGAWLLVGLPAGSLSGSQSLPGAAWFIGVYAWMVGRAG